MFDPSRGDQAGFAAEPDGVLSSQVLPAVWYQQSQVGSCHRLPLQLPGPQLLPGVVREGDLRPVLPGDGHRGFTGNHGGGRPTHTHLIITSSVPLSM